MRNLIIITALCVLSSCYRANNPHKNDPKLTNPCPHEFIKLRNTLKRIQIGIERKLRPESDLEKCVDNCKKMETFEFEPCQIRRTRKGAGIKVRSKEQLMEICNHLGDKK